MYLIGDRRGWRKGIGLTIKEQSVQPNALGTQDIGREIIPYHERGFRPCTGLFQGIGEEKRAGFVGPCVLAQYDVLEVTKHIGCLEFLVLHFVETVTAQMHPVTTRLQVTHDFVGSLQNSGLAGTTIQEIVAYAQAVNVVESGYGYH